ncbi:MAG: tetratricopeptide repeat protein [Kiritimatiellae bacterium]|nr:tetratricopeptide repeat protein [Kiritimatiellia bacterium]MCO5068738.1 tetratricopeptide repeat protein [Kiritimatiellia bacterium]
MESDPKNIYRVDMHVSPSRRRLQEEEDRSASPKPPPLFGPSDAGAPSRSERRRRRRSSRRQHPDDVARSSNKWIWAGLTLVVLLYCAALAFNMFRERRQRSTASPNAPVAAAPTATGGSPSSPQTPVQASPTVTEDIASLKKALSLVNSVASNRDAERASAEEDILRRAIDLAPDLTEAHRELARLLERKKDYEGAEAEWRAVLSRSPDSVAARVRLAAVFLAGGQPANALEMARWALEDEPYSNESHAIAAAALSELQRPREAIVHLRRLVAIDRDDLAAQNNLGVAYLTIADYREALLVFQEVLRRDAGNSVAFYNLAVCYARQALARDSIETLKLAERKFGRPFVLSWTQSADFDPIREGAEFRGFVGSGSTASSDAKQAPSAEGEAVSTAEGAAPERAASEP